ncbi:hypothetical protein K439DRAFT_1413122 [Ramaria rubella]|nr:hypothetical protein K439DRAFT_1413122 [Ramaria rubella]
MTLLRCYSTQLIVNRVSFRPASNTYLRSRAFADSPRTSPTRYEPDPESEGSAQNVQNDFIGHALFAFRNVGKILAFVGYGTLIIGCVTAVAFEGGHFWIERQMRLDADEDAERWGWEAESWTGGPAGGTSPALGVYGRHVLRAAWYTLQNSSRLGITTTISQDKGGRGAGSLNVAGSYLDLARMYLEAAMDRVRDHDGRLPSDKVGLDLLERHGAILERIGTRAALSRARADYLQILDGRGGERLAQARFAVKLGDVSERLGENEAALTWWATGSSHRENGPSAAPPDKELPTFLSIDLPTQPPASPAAQRTLVAALVSLSAYYSKRKLLVEAKHVQESAMSLIDDMVPTHEVSASSLASRKPRSPGQTLHYMHLMQRKSVLAVHHAEVSYSMATPSVLADPSPLLGPLTDLLTAASSSELVAQQLTGMSLSRGDVTSELSPKTATASPRKVTQSPASSAGLASAYRESRWLRTLAGGILRDARTTAAEAWDLSGVLYGEIKGEDAKALECYERALGWAGGPTESVGAGSAWHSLWERYVEAREKIMKK